jgi:hypothetical protein
VCMTDGRLIVLPHAGLMRFGRGVTFQLGRQNHTNAGPQWRFGPSG